MNKVVAFPDRRQTPTASQEVSNDAGKMSLGELVAQMRQDYEDLARSMDELKAAVHQLADADLPGQARELVNEVLIDDEAAVDRMACAR